MKKTICFLLCILVIAAAANAVTKIYGPVPNCKGTVHESTGLIIPGVCDCYIENPTGGEPIKLFGRESQEVWVHYQVPIFEHTYFEVDLPFDPEVALMKITAIITQDLDPGLDPNQIPETTGFNQFDPELEPLGDGHFEGISGMIYSGITDTYPLGLLPAVLPGYDISKIIGDPASLVYVLQGEVPAFDFVEKPFEFSYEYQGYITQEDPDWRGPKNPEYPFQHFWELDIQEWEDVEYVSDVDIEEPWVIYPGYIEVVPPDDWVSSGIKKGRYGYESNPGAEISAGGGSLGIEWRVNGKTPAVVPGHVVLTMSKIPISKYMNTMVADSEEEHCGDWGYLEADLDEDCDVDFDDLAYHALDWLKCTDPQGADCFYETIIGVGFAFDGEDYNGQAKVAFLHEGSTAEGIIEPNDIIVEYRGHNVTSGAQLLALINALTDLTDGEPVPMTVIKEATGTSVKVEPVAIEIPVVSGNDSSTNQRCVESKITPSNKRYCQCIDGTKICACAWQTKRDQTGKVIEIRYFCSDTGGGKCQGDWLTLK